MNLNDFESHIDRKILARGYDYFENNCVISIKETDASDGLKSKISLGPGNKSSVLPKGKPSSIEDILSQRTKEELVGFLLDIAAEYDEIKQRIELEFGDTNDAEEIGKSIKLIRTFCVIHELMDLLESCDDSDGFVGGAIEETLDFIKGMVEEEEFNPAIKEGFERR